MQNRTTSPRRSGPSAAARLRLSRIVLLAVLVSVAILPAQDTEEPGEELRVLTYNIHMWQPGVKDLAEVIKASDADIVGLNEAWTGAKNEELAKTLGFNIAYGGQKSESKPGKPHWINDHYMPQVLLTKHRIISTRFFNAMAAKEEPAGPDLDPEVPVYRGGLLAELETGTGKRLMVFVVHLHPWGGAGNEKMTTMRLREIEGVVRKLAPHRDQPILLFGDFNTRSHLDGEEGWKVTPFLERERFADLFRGVHPDPEAKPGITCGEAGRIDYIFHNRLVSPVACRVVEAGVFTSKGYGQSDHLGVFGVVRIR